MDLFGRSATTDNLAPFQNLHLQSRLREIAGGHKTVMPPANDDDVQELHLSALPILQQLHRGVTTRRSHYAAAGMGC